jgi:ubiquitin-protein ligase
MDLPSHLTLTSIHSDDPLHLILRIQPQDGQPNPSMGVHLQQWTNLADAFSSGLYVGGQFAFGVDVPLDYPFEAPKVRCLQSVRYLPRTPIS